MIYFNHFCFIFRTFVLLYSKSSIGRTLSDDINIETDNFDNGVYWITPSTLGNPSGSYGRLVKMDNYKMFVSATATSGIYYARELWVSIYVNSTWTSFNCFSDDATVLGQSRLDMMQLTNEDLDSLFAPEYLNKFFYASNNTCTNKPSGVGSFGGVTRRYGAGSYT